VTFTVHIDADRWRAHQKRVLDDLPGLVPVAKGNGYGVGNARLAAEAAALGVDTLAVGTGLEVDEVREQFPGDVLVLTPVLPGASPAVEDRVIRTVAHVGVLSALPPGSRVVVECRTSMNRHGLRPAELAAVPGLLDGARLEGFALHLPLDRPDGVDPVAETAAWIDRLREAGLPTSTIWVSHLSGPELAGLRQRHPDIAFRPRVGTRLWLGDGAALQARGTVLDVEPLRRGQRSGYRQHRAPSAGHLVVVSGGTAHGVALEAPKAVRGPVPRAKVLALGTLEAVGRNLSPFSWAGKQRWFIEPPHMQVSLIFLPHGVEPPAIGDELDCQVRLTTTHADRVIDD
jgi:alanine racemase-like protein